MTDQLGRAVPILTLLAILAGIWLGAAIFNAIS